MVIAKQTPQMNRRTFLSGTAGTTLVMGLGVVLPGCSNEEAASDLAAAGASKRFSPAVWFEISGTGAVLINIAKAEMGQHVGTALARIVAEELGADWSSVSIKHVDSDPKWGFMVTGGSWSVLTSFTMLSQAGAAGRTILIDAGAKLLGVEPAACRVENGNVIAGDQQVSFARIVAEGDTSRVFTDEEMAAMPVKAAADRTLIGKATSALDIPEKTTGGAVYGLDTELPDMVYAHPMIPPTRYGSSIQSVDDTAARDIPGYLQTMQVTDPSDIIQGWALVIADDFPAAMKAADVVEIDWAPGPTAAVTEEHILAEGQKLTEDPAMRAMSPQPGKQRQIH
jgi:CO/xanthine dehydrogenase Mo-binding subunit